jgi:hypothetical protein
MPGRPGCIGSGRGHGLPLPPVPCPTHPPFDAGLNFDDVVSCIIAAGSLSVDGGVNTLLETEVALVTEKLIISLPTIIINGQVERGVCVRGLGGEGGGADLRASPLPTPPDPPAAPRSRIWAQ